MSRTGDDGAARQTAAHQGLPDLLNGSVDDAAAAQGPEQAIAETVEMLVRHGACHHAALDDTDMPETPGTNKLAFHLAERLAPRYMRDGDDVRIDAIFLVPGRLPRHLADVWQG